MSDYTPTTKEVREEYSITVIDGTVLPARARAFDRWFTEEIRKAKHEAFAEGIYQAETDLEEGRETFTNPYDKEDR